MKKASIVTPIIGKNHIGVVVAIPAVNFNFPKAMTTCQFTFLAGHGDADLIASYAGRGRAHLGGRRAVVHGSGIRMIAPRRLNILSVFIFRIKLALMIAAGAGPSAICRIGVTCPYLDKFACLLLAIRITRRSRRRGQYREQQKGC